LHALEKPGTQPGGHAMAPPIRPPKFNRALQGREYTGAHFPKSAIRRRNTFSRTSEIYDSRAAFLKSLKSIMPRVSQGLQIGGTSLECSDPLPGQTEVDMADQVCGLRTEQAAEDLLKAAKVCLLNLMPGGALGTALFLFLVLCLLIAPFVFQYFLGLVGQGSQPEDSLERQDYERLRASLAGDNRPAKLYAQWLSKFLDWI
jgi:hypothetical protein